MAAPRIGRVRRADRVYRDASCLALPVDAAGETDESGTRGIAEKMRIGHRRPVHVKSPGAQTARTALAARTETVGGSLQVEDTRSEICSAPTGSRSAPYPNHFEARVVELLEIAGLPALKAAILPLLTVRRAVKEAWNALDHPMTAPAGTAT